MTALILQSINLLLLGYFICKVISESNETRELIYALQHRVNLIERDIRLQAAYLNENIFTEEPKINE